jgi:hypothetical protein
MIFCTVKDLGNVNKLFYSDFLVCIQDEKEPCVYRCVYIYILTYIIYWSTNCVKYRLRCAKTVKKNKKNNNGTARRFHTLVHYLVYASYSEPNQDSAGLQDFATRFLSLNVISVHASQCLVAKWHACNRGFLIRFVKYKSNHHTRT